MKEAPLKLETNYPYTFKDGYELQLIDTNCNNCIFLHRDFMKYKYWEDKKREYDLSVFNQEKQKAIDDAQAVINSAVDEQGIRSGNGMLRVANKMKFQFDKTGLINYGACDKLNKPISFLSGVCMPENTNCFKHRKDT